MAARNPFRYLTLGFCLIKNNVPRTRRGAKTAVHIEPVSPVPGTLPIWLCDWSVAKRKSKNLAYERKKANAPKRSMLLRWEYPNGISIANRGVNAFRIDTGVGPVWPICRSGTPVGFLSRLVRRTGNNGRLWFRVFYPETRCFFSRILIISPQWDIVSCKRTLWDPQCSGSTKL